MKYIVQKIKENHITILLCLFAFVIGFFFSSGQISDYDYWFHYRAGEYFLTNFQVPQTPIGSWYGMEQGLEWISHEWLFGCFIYLISNWFGDVGVYLFVPLMIGFVLSLTVFLFRDVFKVNIVLSVIGITLTAAIMGMGASPRPQLFAYLFSVLLLYILKKDSEEDSKVLYWLPILTIFWVNMHGGSYIMIHLCLLINIIIHLFDFNLGKISFEKQDRNRLNRRLFVLLLCMIAIFINGHGYKMVLYPFVNISDSLMQSSITEWASPDLKISSHYKIYAMIVLGLCAMISTKKKIKAFDMMTFFLYLVLTSRSIRFAPQLCLVGLPIMLSYADSLNFVKIEKWKGVLLGGLTIMFLIYGGLMTMKTIQDPFELSNMPSDEMIEKVKETNPQRLLNGYNEGGYLVYKGIDVFWDGRADIYSSHNLRDGIRIFNFSANAKDLIKEYGFDYILIRKNQTLFNYLEDNDGFELIVQDKDFYFYKVK